MERDPEGGRSGGGGGGRLGGERCCEVDASVLRIG